MTMHPNGWEPDPRRVGNWRALFDTPQRGGGEPAPSSFPESDDAALIYTAEYRPWTTQRVGPTTMLHLRRFEAKAGLWTGWLLPYSGLYALSYVGNTVSLDFGSRQFVVEGRGLEGLVHLVQQGSLQAVVEYCADAWPRPADGPVVTAIRPIRRSLDG